MIEKLRDKFVGKICTVLTNPTSFPFSDAVQHHQFFTGKVTDIDTSGVWLLHIHTNTHSFYPFPIIGIVEEQVIPHNDPRAEKIKEELKKKVPPPQNFVSVDSFTKMIKDSKQT